MQAPLESMIKVIVIKQMEIKRVSLSVFSGDDFCFVSSSELPILEPIIFEVNSDNEIVSKESLPDLEVEKRRRFRKKDVDKYTNIRLVGEGINLELTKYKPKVK